MTHRGIMALVFAAVLVALPAQSAHASPDVPMCLADGSNASDPPLSLIQWRAPMCGPYFSAFAVAEAKPPKERAIEAYLAANDQIAAASYEEARLQLDLARRGLPRIVDRIALQSARLELLRNQPARAAAFFAEALQSPHESVRFEARYGEVLSLLRADDPRTDELMGHLLDDYPEVPKRGELIFEQVQSLIRRSRYEEAIAVMHAFRVEHPGNRIADWAEAELNRLETLGYRTPSMTGDERVERARRLVRTGPLDQAKAEIAALLESPLTGEQHAEVHYLAGRLARDEGRWQAAETYLRTAQLFPMDSLAAKRNVESRASGMAETARARDPEYVQRQLSGLRAGRPDESIPSVRLLDILKLASAADLRDDTDSILRTLHKRVGVPSPVLFDAAMSAVGTGSEALIMELLEDLVKRPGSSYHAAGLYHLARAQERSGRLVEAALYFTEAKSTAEALGDVYYALWASNGLRRLEHGERSDSLEGLSSPEGTDAPRAPRTSNRALAQKLEPIGELHWKSYPWIARAADLLRVGEREAATAELFETYLTWRHALGKPIARAGLTCIAQADSRAHEPMANDVRGARLELSKDERSTLAEVAIALGDMGTAGGFEGPEFIETLPRAYEWLAVPAANRYGLDPNLLLAVMRVESAYQKHIVSYAGAVGLMQIMPRTGQLIAHALGRDDFTPADLLDPELNLEFAAWYLTSLIRRFDGRLPLAIAAYNGGPHNVRRWIQESPADVPVDVLLERIPFTQTHRYVRKVLTHYEAYRQQRELSMPQLALTIPTPRVDPLAF